jgi:uncharacterized small protein (DUF1192 family)
MAAIDSDDLPKKKVTHELGQDLALLSVAELAERIALLKDEIARLADGRERILQKVKVQPRPARVKLERVSPTVGASLTFR